MRCERRRTDEYACKRQGIAACIKQTHRLDERTRDLSRSYSFELCVMHEAGMVKMRRLGKLVKAP